MYKRFSLDEIQTIKNNFIANLAMTMRREKTYDLKVFLKFSFSRGDDVYYFSRGNPLFHLAKQGETYQFVDEKDKVELLLTAETLPRLSAMIKKYMTKRNQLMPIKSIASILVEEFSSGHYMTIEDKPYLVYDIETSSNISNLKQTKFYLAYMMTPGAGNKMVYEYIAQDDIKKFTKKMLDFDGYIIGFNNI
jgi:translation elongation factor P/translation initiation factor 5A